MGKINGCLKRVFISFNVLFAIVGGLLMYGAFKASALSAQYSSVGTPGIGWAWVFAIGMLGISCLGIYAGSSEKALALKIFAGFLLVGMVVMLIFGIYVAVMRNKVKDAFTNIKSENTQTFMEYEEFRAMMHELQPAVKCCGVTKAEDWGSSIPDSCSCSGSSSGGFGGYEYEEYEAEGCKAKPLDTSGPSQIYAASCGNVLYDFMDIVLKYSLGLFFGFATIALLGLLVTLLMLHQIKRHDGEGPSMSMKTF